ncbi:MarR family transcriptional regulator [Streptomyces violaceoruber]|uniref:Regulatory protein n=6 Tax=Streptomyces TaxID=1883 RepID=Q9AJX9_STRCO|nr:MULTISPECIES: MarR family transcriptional regulator [Streptomyces]MYU47249.1 MarR family transcriptional regulator [Streptomyces sp. SID7813]QSJ06642.1 regulatory protein [Streptomyces lividans]AIJ11140.1 regulatory protein [Streptomyces lividans TK24]EFD64448.1 regulatory protein [Streptomyces lividans TK24]EOY52688.1 Transcriptional regulator, MarR family [Streptomyces lividans 1326]
MTAPNNDPSDTRHVAIQSAGAITELLDVMWEHARHSSADTTAPSSTSQLRLMYVVDGEDGIRMRTVCQRLGSAPPTVTRMCDRLQAIGFLERLPCPDNGREIALRLTHTGKKHLQRIREQRDTMLHQAIDGMPPAQRRALATGLAALQTQLNAVHGERHHTSGSHSAA